jgi:UDP-glucose 4-epimerase
MPSDLSGKTCLVLGAGGFIGINLCRALVKAGVAVRGFGRVPAYPVAMPDIPWTRAEFTDRPALAQALQGAEVVFHLLGGSIPEAAEKDPAGDLRVNAAASVDLLGLCQLAGVKRIVFISSGGTVYGVPRCIPIPESHPTDPISAYGIHKLLVEKYLGLMAHRHGLRATVLRAANPYGPYQSPGRGQGVIATLIGRRLTGQSVEIWGDGSVVRDFLHVGDLVDAMLLAAAYDGPHHVLNVGSGRGRSILEVVTSIDAVLEMEGSSVLHKPGRAVDVPANVLDISLAKRELGWVVRREWKQGLMETADWLRHSALVGVDPAGVNEGRKRG